LLFPICFAYICFAFLLCVSEYLFIAGTLSFPALAQGYLVNSQEAVSAGRSGPDHVACNVVGNVVVAAVCLEISITCTCCD
jgi:hypothetical protein